MSSFYNDHEAVYKDFIWSRAKEIENRARHGLDFTTAAQAFADPRRLIYVDQQHSRVEERFFCLVLRLVITMTYIQSQKINKITRSALVLSK
ncbi:MAG: BrnT family toxin [Deltaproteobacteria bacterium]|nr:BrnT family toxin [Deltaproteobacteria bacterium]MBI2500612.1 BrnT family toxin [Deltaproteobacteria bacterium]MBI4196727.1 BrnT family toxin [Deltaproteobacteria bacterium]